MLFVTHVPGQNVTHVPGLHREPSARMVVEISTITDLR